MENITFCDFIIALIVLIITIIVLVKFFRLCKDIRAIREVVESNWAIKPVIEAFENRAKGDLCPSKSDVREFQDKIKEYKKMHKDIDQQWIENLIDEYNEKFNEDFHQYL
jgi:predicted Holliday junction resolvase-like endonuclease